MDLDPPAGTQRSRMPAARLAEQASAAWESRAERPLALEGVGQQAGAQAGFLRSGSRRRLRPSALHPGMRSRKDRASLPAAARVRAARRAVHQGFRMKLAPLPSTLQQAERRFQSRTRNARIPALPVFIAFSFGIASGARPRRCARCHRDSCSGAPSQARVLPCQNWLQEPRRRLVGGGESRPGWDGR